MADELNLEVYQTVKIRKDLFAEDHPTGIFLALPGEISDAHAFFTVLVWKTHEGYERGAQRLKETLTAGGQISDQQAILLMSPDGIGTAYEAKWMGDVSATSWTENAEESAIGRALDNIGYHGNGKCSREEILKAQEAAAALVHARSPEETREGIKQEGEDVFGKTLDLPPEYPAFKRYTEETYKGKHGVSDLRAVVSKARQLRWPEGRLLAWILEQGVDLENGAKTSDFAKLRFRIEQEVTT